MQIFVSREKRWQLALGEGLRSLLREKRRGENEEWRKLTEEIFIRSC